MAQPTNSFFDVYLSASDRISGTPEKFRIKLSDTLERIRQLRLKSCVIPYTWYEVQTGTELWYQEQAGGLAYHLTIPAQHWVPSDLATFLSTEMTLNSPNTLTYTVTYDSTQGKYTFTATGNFSLLWTSASATNPTNYLWYQMGFNNTPNVIGPDPNTAYASVQTSSGVASTTYDYLFLILTASIANPTITTDNRTVTCVLPVNGNFLDKCYYAQGRDYLCEIDFGSNGEFIRELGVQITPPYAVADFSLNGVDPDFLFTFISYK